MDKIKTFMESYFKSNELKPNTTFEELKKMETLMVYRSSAKRDKSEYSAGVHAGTKQQALIRADYMLNDEEKFDVYYLYQIIIELGKVYPDLVEDDGSDHGLDYGLDFAKGYDTLVYKNTGEGDVNNENLSIIILNPKNITYVGQKETLTPEGLQAIQNELY